MGRITKKINPDLTEKEAVYNDASNCVKIYDELDHYTIQYYDGIGRLTKTEAYVSTLNLTEVYTYNYQNNVKTHTDPGGPTIDKEGNVVSAGVITIDIEAFKYGAAGLAIIMTHELKHVEQHKKDFSYYFNNQDVAEEEAYQAAKEMYDRLRPLYTYWNPLDWSTIWHMNNALEDAL